MLLNQGAMLTAITEITLLSKGQFLNFSCQLVQKQDSLGVEYCDIGRYSFSGSGVDSLLSYMLNNILGSTGELAFQNLMANSTFDNDSITIHSGDAFAFKDAGLNYEISRFYLTQGTQEEI